MEGFDPLTKCPNYTPATVPAEVKVPGAEPSVEIEVAEPEEDHHITLPSGDALTANDAHRLTSGAQSTVVMLVGMVKSGKTTVLAEIFERFRLGPFAGHLFAGTRTIMGFERVCHYARAASQGEVEDTGRTVRGIENNLLHLDLVHQDSRARKRLLISDLSGEDFQEGTLTADSMHSIPYLRSCRPLRCICRLRKTLRRRDAPVIVAPDHGFD